MSAAEAPVTAAATATGTSVEDASASLVDALTWSTTPSVRAITYDVTSYGAKTGAMDVVIVVTVDVDVDVGVMMHMSMMTWYNDARR